MLGLVCGVAGAGASAAQTAPDLGTAGAFGVAASTFTNTSAATTVNGDVCFTNGPGAGYTLNGIQSVPCSAQVGLDQNSALATLTGQGCTSLGAGAVVLDTTVVGLNPAGTFPPGCYSSGGAMTVTNLATVTLSGAGVYIFRPGGSLGTGNGSAISLTNGATEANVYWAPSQATTLGANTVFVGTDIDAAGITIGHLTTITGRALGYGGTVTTDAAAISVPGFIPAPAVPALSGWALAGLAVLVGGLGVLVVRRRSFASV